MTYQSLYRRYRPQRFSEVKGQEHVATALRNAVRDGRVSHAYLFSGPRGTGKTSTARILAKALNCSELSDGEPCGVCSSCEMVTVGNSMDVTELDAASHNGVDAMRDLVARASLGTSGRHRVFIVDEVHMLSTAASNALLKTLEEPPAHVVFVLATTDPQKVLSTITSRTQHFEFRLLSTDLLQAHVRWVAAEAGIELDPAALDEVARRGRGSARDALSALDQAAAAGGVDERTGGVAEIITALLARDAAAVLEAVAGAFDRGRDARQLGRDLVEQLRQVFLAVMAPNLVAAGAGDAARQWARLTSPPVVTRSIEVLGEALVDQRDALDPRLTLEVALVRLARPDIDISAAALLERIERLEQGRAGSGTPAQGTVPGSPGGESSPGTALPRSTSGPGLPGGESSPGTALPRSASGPDSSGPVSAHPAPWDSVVQRGAPTAPTGAGPFDSLREGSTGPRAGAHRPTSVSRPPPPPPEREGGPGGGGRRGVADEARAALQGVINPGSIRPRPGPAQETPTLPPLPNPTPLAARPAGPNPDPMEPAGTDRWAAALDRLARGTRALFAGCRATFADDAGLSVVIVAVPNDPHRTRAEAKIAELEAALADEAGAGPVVRLVIDASAGEPPLRDEAVPLATASARIVAEVANVDRHRAEHDLDDQDIDLHDLVDAGPAQVTSGIDLVLKAFGPNTVIVEEG